MSLNAKSPYDPILSGIGALDKGKISETARKKFVEEVSLLLVAGNLSGKTLKPISNIFPFPPVSGPLIPAVNQHLFWFDKFMTAESVIALQDRNKSPIWHQIFVDTLYQNTLQALDLAGNTAIFPIFDPSAPFGVELSYPFSQVDLIKAIKTTPPQFAAKVAKAGIKLSIPSIPIPKIPSFSPTTVQFKLDGSFAITPSGLPPIPQLPVLLTELIKLPFDTLTSLLVPSKFVELVAHIPELPKSLANLVFEAFTKILEKIGFASQLLPATIIASILVYLKNIIACLCVIIIGNILGTGVITLNVGKLLGLV
jgi:hypothetical protein